VVHRQRRGTAQLSQMEAGGVFGGLEGLGMPDGRKLLTKSLPPWPLIRRPFGGGGDAGADEERQNLEGQKE